MFTKKNMIVIALIAIFVMGAVALSAVTFQVIVHVQGSGNGWHQTTGGNQIPCNWYNGENPLTVNGNLGSGFECYGDGGINGSTDSDGGTLDPNNVNHFYLDLRPPKKDDGTPGSQ